MAPTSSHVAVGWDRQNAKIVEMMEIIAHQEWFDSRPLLYAKYADCTTMGGQQKHRNIHVLAKMTAGLTG